MKKDKRCFCGHLESKCGGTRNTFADREKRNPLRNRRTVYWYPFLNKSCLFFDGHLEKEEWKNAAKDDYWPIWDQVEAMRKGYTPKVCDCMKLDPK